MNDLILNDGSTAKYLYTDYWSRPVYQLENGSRVCCIELNGTHLHTMSRDGEPEYPIKNQPVKDK